MISLPRLRFPRRKSRLIATIIGILLFVAYLDRRLSSTPENRHSFGFSFYRTNDAAESDDELFGAIDAKQFRVPSSNQGRGVVKDEELARPSSKPSHIYLPNGLVEVNPEGRHPIYDIIARAERNWEAKLAKQSKTLAEAVRQYKRRYNRNPPLGFDKWWDYVEAHNVQLPDEYDRIFHDLEPFWGMKPSEVRRLQQKLEAKDSTYTIANGVNGYGPLMVVKGLDTITHTELFEKRATLTVMMLSPIRQWLPPFRATFWAHDSPIVFIGHDFKTEAIDAASVQEHISPNSKWDTKYIGWASACPAQSALRRVVNASEHPNVDDIYNKRTKSFIYNHKQSMNPCNHPSHVHLNGQFINYGIGPAPGRDFYPCFTLSTTSLHSDILTIPSENWTEDIGTDPNWDQKPFDTLYWRGSPTGSLNKEQVNWRLSQRLRLVKLANDQTKKYKVLSSTGQDDRVGLPEEVEASNLLQRLLNITLVKVGSNQCYGSVCSEITQEYTFSGYEASSFANNFKYLLDIDGNGWSARFKRLMTSKSLVLKATVSPEWYADRVAEWVHYVPVQMDLSDLLDVMTFFRGDSKGNPGHDELAKKIATAGSVWSKTFWRKEDQTAYIFRLMLEYARVLSPDRDSMSFHYEGS